MRASPNLGTALFGKVRGALLALFYGQAERSFYYREITRELSGLSPGSIQRELKLLGRLGLIHRAERGKQVFYRANVDHPIYSELKQVVFKTTGLIQQLRTALATVATGISVAFVYGSFAQQKEDARSDIDLMVIGSVTLEELIELLSPVERQVSRAINPMVYSQADLTQRIAKGNHFLSSVMRSPKVFVVGEAHELRKMGGVRMA